MHLQSRRRDIRFRFRLGASGPLSFLFDEIQALASDVLTSRRKINKIRRRNARSCLATAETISILRYQHNGAAIKIQSRKHGDFYIPIRQTDCRLIDSWRWVTDISSEEQSIVLEVLDIYEGISLRKVRHLLQDGAVSYDSQHLGRIYLKLEDGVLSSETFKLHPADRTEHEHHILESATEEEVFAHTFSFGLSLDTAA